VILNTILKTSSGEDYSGCPRTSHSITVYYTII
jgi:hypothetical protein